tara:strand:+ start:118 stop:573 length:456 start_codon:yes stop_codon:yes gene_type:complete
MRTNDAAYIAGLFDGEGSLQYKKGWEKKKKHTGKGYRKTNAWRINMEIAMTDESVIRWVHETLKVGSVVKRNVKGLNKAGKKYKTQWRWRCSFRDALYVCKILWPFAQVKMHKIEQIIDHYEPRAQELGDNVVDLATEREVRKFNWNLHGS